MEPLRNAGTEFVNHIQNFLVATQKILTSLPLYKIYPTRSWKLLSESQRSLYEISLRHIEEKIRDIKEHDSGNTEPSDSEDFISYKLHKGQMSLEEVTGNVADLLSAAWSRYCELLNNHACIDTHFLLQTSYTLAWTLYMWPHILKHKRGCVARYLLWWAMKRWSHPLTLNSMSYLRNCIKES